MSKFIGRLCNVGLGKEAVRGTAVAPDFWMPKAVLSFDDKVTKQLSALSYGTINAFGNQSLTAVKWAEGSIEGDVLDKSFGLLLLSALGTVSSASFSGAYKHTYSLQEDNQHDSLTMTVDEPSGDLQFRLAMIESLEITAVPDDVVKFTAEFKSKSSDTGSGSASYSAENKFLGRNITTKIATLTGGLDAASGICLKSLTITITKNLLMDFCLGTVQAQDILNQAFSISGSFELDYEDRTYANLMLDGSYRAMRIDIVNTDVTIGSTNPSFRLDLSRVEFDGWEADRSNDDITKQTINFNALWDITNGNVINSCYLINEQASY